MLIQTSFKSDLVCVCVTYDYYVILNGKFTK